MVKLYTNITQENKAFIGAAWQPGKIYEDWKTADVTPAFRQEDPRNYRLLSLNLLPREVMEQLIQEAKHMKAQETDWESL